MKLSTILCRLGSARTTRVVLVFVLASQSIPAQESPVWEGPAPEVSTFTASDCAKSADPTDGGASIHQNTAGFEAYQAGDFLEAGILFYCSLISDQENAYAHYNYASVLALLAHGIPDFERSSLEHFEADTFSGLAIEYQTAIFEHLEASIVLDDGRLERLREDSDFDILRDFERFRLTALGPKPAAREVVAAVVPDWHPLSGGSFMPEDKLTFLPDNRIRLLYDLARREQVMPEVVWRDLRFEGSYRVDGDTLVIFPDGDDTIVYGTIVLGHNDRGFVTERRIELPSGHYSTYLEHYWNRIDP